MAPPLQAIPRAGRGIMVATAKRAHTSGQVPKHGPDPVNLPPGRGSGISKLACRRLKPK